MLGRTVDFAAQPLGPHVDPAGLGGYYCDLRHKATGTIDGFPRDAFGEDDCWVIPIAQAALGFWELKIEGKPVEREFLGLADWLVANAEPGAGGAVWRTYFSVPKYGLEPGWTTAMGQSQAISVLLRAHLLSGRDEYAELAAEAVESLLLPVSEGGTQSTIDGVPVLEEYPTEKPEAVLNGWIFGLFGLHELALTAGDERARELFDRSAAGLVQLLPRYDIGWWSLYSLGDYGRHDLAKPFYQRLHPVLLEALALIHPAPELGDYARRWRRQLTRRAVLRASVDKLIFRVYRSFR
ncbi:MAG TPA: D-glucuronyl C5-epimerase family protein [Solirubrobacterales bacterium]|nr:D-glucuronyl C5-epimerase family protein [Solirubrobacterales bacterium]